MVNDIDTGKSSTTENKYSSRVDLIAWFCRQTDKLGFVVVRSKCNNAIWESEASVDEKVQQI